MSLPLILAPVVLTVGQLYLGQNHSAGKTVTDATSVCALSAQNHTQHRFRRIIYSCRNEYCQLPFQVFFFFWIMQPHGAHSHLWWNGTVVDGGGGKDGVRRHKQPARLVKKAISEAVMLYIVGIDRQSCFYRNAEPSVGAVCRSASTKWFGHVKAGTRVNPAGRCGFQKIASI